MPLFSLLFSFNFSYIFLKPLSHLAVGRGGGGREDHYFGGIESLTVRLELPSSIVMGVDLFIRVILLVTR